MSELVKLSEISNILSNVGNVFVKNQTLLKCIKFDNVDALSQPDLEIQDIINLIGKGSDPKSQRRIFKVPFNDDIIEEVRTELRFFVSRIPLDNIYLTNLPITFQIIVHNDLWEMDDNLIRPFVIIQEILNELNGREIRKGIGELKLNNSINMVVYNSNFTGYIFDLKTRTR